MSFCLDGRVIRAVIFDMDGLMFDSERLAQQAWQQASRAAGYDLTEDIFRVLVGRTIADVRGEIASVFGENYPFDDVYRHKQFLVDEIIIHEGLVIKPGLMKMIEKFEYLKIRKAIASSSSCNVILRNLRIANIEASSFDVLVGGDEVTHGKPAPDIYLKAADHLEINPENCLVFEDSNAGVQAATNAGMLTVMIPDLVEPDMDSLQHAYLIMPSLADFIPYI